MTTQAQEPRVRPCRRQVNALDERVELATTLLRRAGPTLHRCLQIETATTRVTRLDRQRDLLTGIINALTDPVVLTNAENDILLTNRRAEQLFSFTDTDSEGRRRAVQINNLLSFSPVKGALDRSAASHGFCGP